ncbi:hypothetical protein FA15DRAFT_463470 [Coprinopsis marcescibilis]|uniref:Uncharacterized protein n=1 Tax=Coprinopsis marcescibilis TaxID=230819 RepID=A0A5C3KT95_COPMA|nr:hypothetical protein FA15DRAFT_463470 [Coprinopsis marcescibilis]
MTTCVFSPTRTLYATRTLFRVAETERVTDVVPVSPSISTSVISTQVCSPRPNGGRNCRPITRTTRIPIPGSSSTRIRTMTRNGGGVRTIVTTPTATLYATSPCFPTSGPSSRGHGGGGSGSSNPTLTASLTSAEIGASAFSGSFPSGHTHEPTFTGPRTLANPDPSDGGLENLGPSPGVIAGAVVGGLLGGFITPILLVLLIRHWLKRRRRRTGSIFGSTASHSPPDMRSINGSGSIRPISPRPLSPYGSTLFRSPTMSDGGHHVAFVNQPADLDRRISRTSRATVSRAPSSTYPDRRQGASPTSSSHGHGYESPPLLSPGVVNNNMNIPPSRRPSWGHVPHSHPPVAFNISRAASPSNSLSFVPGGGSASSAGMQGYVGNAFVAPYDYSVYRRRSTGSAGHPSGAGRENHPHAQGQGQPMFYVAGNDGSRGVMQSSPVGTPPQEHAPHLDVGHGYVAGAPLPSVDEHGSPSDRSGRTTSNAPSVESGETVREEGGSGKGGSKDSHKGVDRSGSERTRTPTMTDNGHGPPVKDEARTS